MKWADDHFAGRMELARSMVKEGELSLVKIGRRFFVQAEDLDYRAHLGSTGAAPMPQ